MFKFVVVLAFVAACSATYNVGLSNTYLVDVGKDYIQISTQYGKQVKFLVEKYYGYEGNQEILVEFYGQDVAPKTVKYFDEKVIREGRYQSDILYQIFNQYNGQIDEIQYEQLLNIISEYVQNRQIHPVVLYALRALLGDHEALTYFYKYSHETPYNKFGFYGKGYQYGDYNRDYYHRDQYQTPYNKFGFYFGKTYGYGDYNKNYNQRWLGQYYPTQYGYNKDVSEGYYGPFNSEYTRGQRLYEETPYKKFGFLFGKGYGYGDLNTYDREFGVKSFYPSKYGYQQEFYGPYNRDYQQIKGQYGFEYPQKFYEGYGQYPKFGYQYGETYGVEYPQQYKGIYSQDYYGPYAHQYKQLFQGYEDNFKYQKPYYF